MFTTAIKPFQTLLLLVLFSGMAIGQSGLCPSNLDFETGNFNGWECRTGGAANALPLPTIGIVPGRHTIIDAATAGRDLYGNFPTNCPNGGGYSIKLGNQINGSQAESVSYTYTIPSGLTVFSMLIYYAVVLENPSGHPLSNQPRFQARIIDLSTNAPIPCVNFDFISSTAPGGFRLSPIPGNLGDPVLYKDWTPVSINLNAYIGRTIRLEFVTRDCTQSGHAGYAYIDVGASCNGAITGNFICPGNAGITMNAPFGFQNYTWYSDNTFSTVISTSQTLTLNPAPAVGTIFPIVVEPFTGFGCRDTLYADVQIAPEPVSVAGPDADVCTNAPIQLGTTSQIGLSYAWTPAGQVSNATISNPMGFSLLGPSTEFVVKTTDILTGCYSYDTTYITGKKADTTLTYSGLTSYCVGDPLAITLSVSNLLSSVQWYNGNIPIPGATGFTYQPLTSGNYWAQVGQVGCTDSTRITSIVANQAPIADAGPNRNVCINETIQLGVPANPSYTYAWTPAAQVSNATAATPMAWAISTNPQEFIVEVTNAATGCKSFDTTVITGQIMDTTLRQTGKNDYCDADPAKGILSVSNSLSAVQWYNGNAIIPGATNFTYQPTVSGNYWAQLGQSGCTDSTRTIQFDIHATPVADFTMSSDSACATNHSFLFTNQSVASDGAAMTYLWQMSDGSTQTITDAVKTFSSPGTYRVKLITTTSFGCVDDAGDSTVYVMPNSIPDFTWDSICINRPVLFINQSNENGSPLVKYNWNFNDGGPASLIKNPLPVTYTAAGQTDVTLQVTNLGCEADIKSITKKVQVNPGHTGIRYRTITVPQGASQFIHVRDSIGSVYNWKPPTQLSRYTTQYTEFFANGNDVQYLIDITDKHTCVTTDTIMMQILKKPGYYLPTGFTPNGDGLNDEAIPFLVGMKSLKSFSVFNRWGNLVFYTTTQGKGWDGKQNGQMLNTGVFVWILEFYNSDNKLVSEKGTITLIR